MPTLTKVISRSYTYLSSSGRGTYQTLLYDDKTTSCDCPGWTRRIAADGSRSCKHTRFVAQGMGEVTCQAHHDHTRDQAPNPLSQTLSQTPRRPDAVAKATPPVFAELGQRKLNPA